MLSNPSCALKAVAALSKTATADVSAWVDADRELVHPGIEAGSPRQDHGAGLLESVRRARSLEVAPFV